LKKLDSFAAIRFIFSIAICLTAGMIGSVFTTPAIPTWYAGLRKPDLAPPNWVFAPVWTTLFLLMGISLFLVWNVGLGKSSVRYSFTSFFAQLVLNVLWSYLFFGLRSPLLGLLDIIVLWFAIALTVVFFFKVSKIAAVMLIPYLAWVSVAAYLNYLILKLNP